MSAIINTKPTTAGPKASSTPIRPAFTIITPSTASGNNDKAVRVLTADSGYGSQADEDKAKGTENGDAIAEKSTGSNEDEEDQPWDTPEDDLEDYFGYGYNAMQSRRC